MDELVACEGGVAWISAYSGHSSFAWSLAVGVWFWPVGFRGATTFLPYTETRNDKTKRMNLLVKKVESPEPPRTAVILVSRGVTLLVCGFVQMVLRDATNIYATHRNTECVKPNG